MLTLFHVQRAANLDMPTHDTMRACVVAAPYGGAARRIASQHSGDEGAQVWEHPSTTVTVIGRAVDGLSEGLICRDFVHG
jgi:hypothetical protein